MRQFICAANWKMNKGPEDVRQFFSEFQAPHTSYERIVFPMALAIETTANVAKSKGFEWGSQNCHFEKSGAFTGELSPHILASMGAKYALIGHSERRTLFGETNDLLAKKVLSAQQSGLIPMLCIGETLAERQAGKTLSVVSNQLQIGLSLVKDHFVIAYEPVWAIGTGQVATPDQVQEVHAFIRRWLADNKGLEHISVLYGGSVKAGSAQQLANLSDVDGFLVGGAALDPKEFSSICAVEKTY